jgi:nitrogen fixation NifU-like protein
MSLDLYKAVILEELESPQNKEVMADADCIKHTTNASCGDDVTVYIKLSADKTRIEKLTWMGSGCAISQATNSLLSEEVQGKHLSAVEALTQQDMEQLLGLDHPIAPGRIKCLLLGLKAIQDSLKVLDDRDLHSSTRKSR